MNQMEERVKSYWTRRAQDFGTVRRMELQDQISGRWMEEINKYLPKEKELRILDVGTGTGYFAVLLAEQGHRVYGIDLTPAMIEEAKRLAGERGISIEFAVMDAQSLDFPEESFDVVIARNLTWTLPKPEQAYREWMRVLAKGGILLNFDADYGREVQSMEENGPAAGADASGFHIGVTQELRQESNEITKAMAISKNRRPDWDIAIMKEMGFVQCQCDREAGARILKERNSEAAPTFLMTVRK